MILLRIPLCFLSFPISISPAFLPLFSPFPFLSYQYFPFPLFLLNFSNSSSFFAFTPYSFVSFPSLLFPVPLISSPLFLILPLFIPFCFLFLPFSPPFFSILSDSFSFFVSAPNSFLSFSSSVFPVYLSFILPCF